jgi:hypothetical protein
MRDLRDDPPAGVATDEGDAVDVIQIDDPEVINGEYPD